MSNTGQSNGKKSSNNSAVNTPASTPVTNGNLPSSTHCSPPLNNNAPNAPKYGTLVPNRIFVGGISANTTEGELMQLFSIYGTVKAAKIIQDRAGVSKGYGFITFENEDDARRPLRDSDNIVLRERKLNIAPAIKKQPFGIRAPPPSVFDGCPPGPGASPAPAPPPPIFFPPAAAAPYFQAYYVPPPPPQTQSHGGPGGQDQQHGQSQAQQVYQTSPMYTGQTGHPQAAAYPSMMFPQPIYMPQQYPAMAMPFDYTVYPGNGGGPPGGPPPFGPGHCTPSGSSSPPRGPCYATAAYATGPPGPAEALFYNPTMQMFHTGGSMDGAGPALYAATEAFDLGPHLAQYAEEAVAVEGSSIELQLQPPPPQPPAAPQSPSTERNSATPVVSVLNLDKQQERDFASMQGGRRPRPSSPRKPPMMNGFVPSMTYSSFNGGASPRYNNNPPPLNRMRYRKTFTQPPQQQFNNDNEERDKQTPPPRPPAPYSPLDRRIQHQRNMSYHHHHPHFVAPPPSQVHPPQAVFSPPMRRPQRGKPLRRYPMPSEIGAGDAPLPSSTSANAADDVIAKVDALKI